MFLSLWSNIVGKLSSNITIYRLVGTELNGIKELNWLCKHMKNVRRSQPCISMIFFSKHKFFHVSIVNRQINGQRASVFTFEKGQRGTRLSDSRKIPLRKIAPPPRALIPTLIVNQTLTLTGGQFSGHRLAVG